MKIKKIIRQHRRDFTALYICEHCSAEQESIGYDDDYFHHKVIPEMICKECDKKAPKNYQALGTKYAAHQIGRPAFD
jgi:protein-arginine kinase activator protein McsA